MRVLVKGDAMRRRSRRVAGSSGGMAALAGIVFCVLAVSCVSLVDGATDPGDVNALNQIFSDLNNDPRLTNWVQSAGDPCSNKWLGVTCQGTFVTSIKLPNLGLNGKVQGWVLQKLQHLSVLDLSQNNFDSDIPGMYPPMLTDLNLSNNQFTGAFPYLLTYIPSLISIKLNNNKLDGTLNGQVLSKLGNLSTLDLSNNEFTGSIPTEVGDLTSLQFLYLQNNKLTGPLPASLANLPVLDTLDVSNNQLTGYIPPNLEVNNFRFGGNQISNSAPPPPPYTAPPPPKNPRPVSPPKSIQDSSKSSSFLTGARIAGIVVVIVLVLVAIAIAVWFFVIRNKPERAKTSDLEANHSSQRTWFLPLIPTGKEKTTKVKVFEPDTVEKGIDLVSLEPKIKASPPVKTLKVRPAFKGEEIVKKQAALVKTKSSISATAFSVAELQAATNSFSEANLLGEGSLGCLYRAEFPNGQVLAVKKLDTDASMVQNESDFLGVVDSLARLQHTNSAELVGYCVEHGQRLLVYEYISRGTLDVLLHGSVDSNKGLSWNMRVKIALGFARALEYLHEICSPPVVHRNLKSANILLDDELNPHVSDCGLSALAPSSTEHQVSAQTLSSLGYSAPEYSMSGTYTVKSDVYSFGVVMLELVTGRKPLDSSKSRLEQNLVRWATPQLHDIDALAKMVDPALEGAYPAKSLSRFADIVALCVQPEPEFRPPMSEVVQSLVRLMQRATLSIMRRAESETGASQSDIKDSHDCL